MPRRATRCAAIVCSPSASASSPANAPNAASRPRRNISSCPARCARSRRCRFPCRCRFSATASLLNNPVEPYWPRYEGDEDTRRKPAYHNGTAWTWTFPTFCEALARGVGFFAGSRGGGEKLSRQRGKIVERRLPRPDSRNSRRRRAAHPARLRRAGVGRDGGVARVEAAFLKSSPAARKHLPVLSQSPTRLGRVPTVPRRRTTGFRQSPIIPAPRMTVRRRGTIGLRHGTTVP